ncbi:hypothetical protein ASPBRDRAFT_200952 [Aspergillus brasiliensis CBS 101740]|uniref:Uncharacterized protein n=1 Tax=Aspergillus brasiliensis (strain CBS 101740 / IMI 381727 / IBT 21946) TaxID=767769 RepID=A0A1L9U3U2_ASPBC|nr:hypothetical protein ASPBRDRAFT_200952 [Aspergillus brasiliensis CBS 101740]
MSVLPPRYLVPPVGVRTEKPDESGNLTRRDPDTGPYGVFIENNELLALPCPADHVPAYGPYWHRATDQLRLLLWGSEEDRITAADTLDSLNIEIDVQSTEMRQPLGTGFIEVDNWRNAGSQLRLALRDLHVYRSTARFEDVRDFIWERIQRNNYPTEWRVTRQEFEAQIQNTTNYYNALRERDGLDNEDGIFYELELEEGRRHEELAEELGQSPPPAYDLPPPYIHSETFFETPRSADGSRDRPTPTATCSYPPSSIF